MNSEETSLSEVPESLKLVISGLGSHQELRVSHPGNLLHPDPHKGLDSSAVCFTEKPALSCTTPQSQPAIGLAEGKRGQVFPTVYLVPWNRQPDCRVFTSCSSPREQDVGLSKRSFQGETTDLGDARKIRQLLF